MSEFLSVAFEAVESVKELILHGQKHLQQIETKSDNSLVTEIDRQVEEQIKSIILKRFPDHGFYGEEFGITNGNEYTWIIDPIDGTREFTRGLPLFSTLLALKKGDEFIVGVASAPGLSDTISAEKGHGAWRNGQRVSVSKIDNLRDAFILGSAYKYLKRTNTFPAMAELSEAVRGTRNVGGWGYHWVASGQAEAMVEVDTHIYDVAPFAVIIPEAGGRFTALDGGQITLETKHFLASNGLLHQQIIQYFSRP